MSGEVEKIKNEWMSKMNDTTKEFLSKEFDWEAHKERGISSYKKSGAINSICCSDQNYTGKLYSDVILNDISKLKQKPNILDVGCGQGQFVSEMANSSQFEKVYGVDPFSIPSNNFLKNKGGEYIESWSHDIPLDDKSVDIITCCEVLEHVPESHVLKTLEEFKRLTTWRVYGQVATRLGGEKYKNIEETPEAIHAHLCFAPAEWWSEQMEKVGFKIVDSSTNWQGLKFILEV